MFYGCKNLKVEWAKLIPAVYQAHGTLNANYIFRQCDSLIGDPPADILWNNKNITWLNTKNAFYKCSAEIKAKVPASWGGTLSDDIIEKSLEEKYNDLLTRIEKLELK